MESRQKKRKIIQTEYYNRFVSVIDERMYFTEYWKEEMNGVLVKFLFTYLKYVSRQECDLFSLSLFFFCSRQHLPCLNVSENWTGQRIKEKKTKGVMLYYDDN